MNKEESPLAEKIWLTTPFSIDNRNSVQDAMVSLAERLSVSHHKFVSSISTKDIDDLLTKGYADISLSNNRAHLEMSKQITSMIQKLSDQSKNEPSNSDAATTLSSIQKLVTSNTEKQANLLRPFTKLNELVDEIYNQRGIKITERLTIGDTKKAIASDLLSAGEKQMLSFLAYNALLSDGVIFIDEPEISLHVDWQRTLFPILLSQKTNNQFIIATHSPFIYSKYSDKELLLGNDRGE